MDNAVLQIVMRFLHIISMTALVGGMLYVSLVLRPTLKTLDGELRETIQKRAQEGFLRVVHWCILGLIVSGAYNWYLLNDAYNKIPAGQPLIGTKTLLAVIAFAIVWGRSIGLIKLSIKATHMINLHLAAIVMVLGAVLRYLRARHGV